MQRTGLFSNLYYHQDTGDLLGSEIYIAKTSNGYTGVLLLCEGGCLPFILFSPVFDGETLTFTVKEDDGFTGHFKGTLDPLGITGHYGPEPDRPGASGIERWCRKGTYWN